MAEIMSNETIANEVKKAAVRIGKYIRKTPLDYSAYLSKKTGANVYLKLESEQVTGAFKARGSFNKVLKYAEEEIPGQKEKKFYTASSGNHGIAMNLALQAAGKKGRIYLPTNVPKTKEEILLLQNAEIAKFGEDFLDTELEAQRKAKEENGIFVSSYNDRDIIIGPGTITAEILEDLENVDAIFIAVGGGAFISGMSGYAKHVKPSVQIVGCSGVNCNAMEESVRAGRVIEIENLKTLSDGTAGNLVTPSHTLPYCKRNVDRWVSVTEEEIADAIYLMLDIHHKVIEGSAGIALASFLKVKKDYQGQNVVIVICGSSLDTGTLQKIIDSRVGRTL